MTRSPSAQSRHPEGHSARKSPDPREVLSGLAILLLGLGALWFLFWALAA